MLTAILMIALSVLSEALTTFSSPPNDTLRTLWRRNGYPPPRLDPHMLPQCVKHEMGCTPYSELDQVFLESFDLGLTAAIKRGADAKRNLGRIRLFKRSWDEKDCQGDSVHNLWGGPVAAHRFISKMHCEEWPMLPEANISMNIQLPDTKVDNHCDLTMYDGRGCTGNVVYKIDGALGVQLINAQSFCHVMNYPKSVFLGPCT